MQPSVVLGPAANDSHCILFLPCPLFMQRASRGRGTFSAPSSHHSDPGCSPGDYVSNLYTLYKLSAQCRGTVWEAAVPGLLGTGSPGAMIYS